MTDEKYLAKKIIIKFKKEILLGILILIYASTFIFDGAKEKSFTSALLNKKYDVTKIILSAKMEGTLVLEKTGSIWKGEKIFSSDMGEKSFNFIADSSIVEGLLNDARKIGRMYEISHKRESWKMLSLEEHDSFQVKFISKNNEGDEKIVSNLFFGKFDGTKKRIAFRTGSRPDAFQTSGGFSMYLTTSSDWWSAPEILPKIYGEISSKTVASLKVNGKSLNLNDERIMKFLDEIGSLRHGKAAADIAMRPVCDLPRDGDMRQDSVMRPDLEMPALFLQIEDVTGNSYEIQFYGNKDDEQYLSVVKIIPSAVKMQEEKSLLNSMKLMFYVSGWTYGKFETLLEISSSQH